MKKMLINLMVGISMVAMVGCTSNEMKSHVENNTTIVEENNTIDDFILEQRHDDLGVMIDYMGGRITLNDMKDHFTLYSPYWVKEYKEIKNITEDQKQFCIEYIDFCDGIKNYYPQDEQFSDVMDKLTKIYDNNGYTSDKVVQWEEDNK